MREKVVTKVVKNSCSNIIYISLSIMWNVLGGQLDKVMLRLNNI